MPSSGPGGDITGVVAGNNLSPGGESGTVTLNVADPLVQAIIKAVDAAGLKLQDKDSNDALKILDGGAKVVIPDGSVDGAVSHPGLAFMSDETMGIMRGAALNLKLVLGSGNYENIAFYKIGSRYIISTGGDIELQSGGQICIKGYSNNYGQVGLCDGANPGSGLHIKKSQIITVEDATPTPILDLSPLDIDLHEKDVVWIGVVVDANKTDETDRAFYEIRGGFYRNTSGNVTQQGSTISLVDEASDNTWGGIDFALDVPNQRIQVVFVGKAATQIKLRGIVYHFEFQLP